VEKHTSEKFGHFLTNLLKILPRIFLAADISMRPLLCVEAEISASWQHCLLKGVLGETASCRIMDHPSQPMFRRRQGEEVPKKEDTAHLPKQTNLDNSSQEVSRSILSTSSTLIH
jgi:hypothetical protein